LIDREQIGGFKQAYLVMFDQIADPDGSNYPRLRQLIWGAIDQQASALTKRQQSQALSVLTYTTLVTAVACAAADAMGVGSDLQGQQKRIERSGWCLGLGYALSMTHPEVVSGETALELLGTEAMTDLCGIAIPPGTDATFWGEFRVMGEALVNRLFALSPLRPERPETLLYAMGTGMGLCTREEIGIRLKLVRGLVARAYE
jgi:hypothetical protein